MADDEKSQIPAWQQAHSSEPQAEAATEPETGAPTTSSEEPDNLDAPEEPREASLEDARRFLSDENVQTASVEKKAEFLKSKGFSAEQIEALLGEGEQDGGPATAAPPPAPTQSEPEPPTASPGPPAPAAESSPSPSPSSSSGRSDDRSGNMAPIVTYPEFLATSPRPPPLITPSRLLNILSVAGGAWTLLYGTARYAVGPSVAELNDARADYHAHVAEKLGDFVGRLEGAVSEVPYSRDKDGKTVFHNRTGSGGGHGRRRLSVSVSEGAYDDADSTVSDPTELFHRDVGTQTTPPPPPPPSSSLSPFQHGNSDGEGADSDPAREKSAVERQESRLAALRASVQELNNIYAKRATDAADLGDSLRAVRDDVDNLILRPSSMPAFSSADLYTGQTKPPGGDGVDEFRRTKDAIRGVKGMFLSTRAFPAVAAR